MAGDAAVSADGAYRYWLSRTWSRQPPVTFVMLNPSTADAKVDDPTIRRCLGFARRWGYGGLRVVNLYAFRTAHPATLWHVDDPVGPYNDDHLKAAFTASGLVVAAWGARARSDRIAQVLSMAPALTALGVTRAGQPRHPLYVPARATPTSWFAPTYLRPDDSTPGSGVDGGVNGSRWHTILDYSDPADPGLTKRARLPKATVIRR